MKRRPLNSAQRTFGRLRSIGGNICQPSISSRKRTALSMNQRCSFRLPDSTDLPEAMYENIPIAAAKALTVKGFDVQPPASDKPLASTDARHARSARESIARSSGDSLSSTCLSISGGASCTNRVSTDDVTSSSLGLAAAPLRYLGLRVSDVMP